MRETVGFIYRLKNSCEVTNPRTLLRPLNDLVLYVRMRNTNKER